MATDLKDKTNEGSEWVVFPCPSCGKKIKLPVEKASKSKFKCPSCSQVVSLQVTEVEEPEPRLPERSDSPVLISEENPEVEVEAIDEAAEREQFFSNLRTTVEEDKIEDLDVTSEVIEKDGKQVVKRRRRVKKRKKEAAKLDWEDASEVSEGEQSESDEDDQWSYTVDAEVKDDGSVVEHRRRVRKKKRQTLFEKFSGRVSTAFWGLAIVVGVALGGVAIYIGVTGTTSKGPEKKESTFRRDSGEINSRITEDAFAVVEKYLAANSWSEKVPLVRTPNKVRPRMEEHYEENGYEPIEFSKIVANGIDLLSKRTQVYRAETADLVDMVTMIVEFPGTTRIPQWFALERRPIPGAQDEFEYLVDWEVSEGWEGVPFDDFMASGEPGDTAIFRVQLSGAVLFYIEPFQDTHIWHGFQMTNPAKPDFKLFGYVDKDSPLYKQLTDLFLYGAHPIPIVEVKYPKVIYDRGAVEIIRLVNSTWYEEE